MTKEICDDFPSKYVSRIVSVPNRNRTVIVSRTEQRSELSDWRADCTLGLTRRINEGYAVIVAWKLWLASISGMTIGEFVEWLGDTTLIPKGDTAVKLKD